MVPRPARVEFSVTSAPLPFSRKSYLVCSDQGQLFIEKCRPVSESALNQISLYELKTSLGTKAWLGNEFPAMQKLIALPDLNQRHGDAPKNISYVCVVEMRFDSSSEIHRLAYVERREARTKFS